MKKAGAFLMEKCKNCGAELKPGIKFCTKCGTPVDDSVKPTKKESENKNNETMEKIKNHSLNYFAWFKESIVSPSKVNYDNKYFGLVSILLNAMLVAYSFYVLGHQIVSSIMEMFNEAANIFDRTASNRVALPNGISLYLKLLFITAIYFAVFLLVGFACKKYLVDKDTDLFGYANQLASFSNSMIILEIIMSLFLIMVVPSNIAELSSFDSYRSSFVFLIILLTLMSTIWSVSYIASIVIDAGKAKIDKIYVAAITLILTSAVLFFVFKMVFNSLVAQYSNLNILLGAIK